VFPTEGENVIERRTVSYIVCEKRDVIAYGKIKKEFDNGTL